VFLVAIIERGNLLDEDKKVALGLAKISFTLTQSILNSGLISSGFSLN